MLYSFGISFTTSIFFAICSREWAELVKRISASVSIPVIACGGAGTLQHLKDAVQIGGASAVSAGSMFVFYGKHRAVLINYPSYNKVQKVFAD